MEPTTPDVIDTYRLLALRPASVRPRLRPEDELLPLSPAVLLPVLRAPLMEVSALLGPLLEPVLRAAAGADAPLCVGLDAETAAKGEPGGFHARVDLVLAAARRAAFRRPLILHAHLGMLDVEDAGAVEDVKLRVLEAVDAGVTSAQAGGFGEPDAVLMVLRTILAPLWERGLGVVIRVADPPQAAAWAAGWPADLPVDAWDGAAMTGTRRQVLAAGGSAVPPRGWLDVTGPLTAALARSQRVTGQALAELVAALTSPERAEATLFGEAEEWLSRLGARHSAGHAMVALSAEG